MLLCIFISLFSGFIPIGEQFSLQRTMTFLPFFFIGYYAKDIEIKNIINRIPFVFAFALMISSLLIYFFLFNKPISFILTGKCTYWLIIGFSPFQLCLARVLFLFAASIMGVMICRIVPTRPLFSHWGSITLFIYIYHPYAIKVMYYAIKNGYLPQAEWLLIVMSVIIIMGIILLSHIRFLNILLNPVSYILKKRNRSTIKYDI